MSKPMSSPRSSPRAQVNFVHVFCLQLWLHFSAPLGGSLHRLRRLVPRHPAATPQASLDAEDDLWGMLLTTSVDAQMLIGLILYLFLSPITKIGIRNLAAAMRIDTARFFTVEHLAGMIIGIALVHIGRVKIRKTTDACASTGSR